MVDYTRTELRERAAAASGGEGEGVVVLRRRPDSATMRVRMSDGSSVVMKFWERRGWRSGMRRLTGTTPSCREWRVMRRLSGRGVPVAGPIARFTLDRAGFNEVLVMEDLGGVKTAQECVKAALLEGRHDEVDRIERGVIQLTAQIVDAGVLDSDHSFMNMVCEEEGRLCRLDFEVARLAPGPRLRPTLFSHMIARVVGTFVFTVQPDWERSDRFAARLAAELRPPRRVLRRAKKQIDGMLERQRTARGIHSKFGVDW